MSFLNPVSEPVLRFKSTDAGAPQINYNSRVAGDVKAVLKVCLVTGYGTKASAGWSIVNEVGHVAEFVSPSASMSDYRLGIDDTSASNTTWYYQHQNVRTNPKYNTPLKTLSGINKSSAQNGWEMLVTKKGVFFIEKVFSTLASNLSARLTYWGLNKSALDDTGTINVAFFNEGHQGASDFAYQFFNNAVANHLISTRNALKFSGSTPFILPGGTYNTIVDYIFNVSNTDIASPLYLTDGKSFVGQQPGILTQVVNQESQVYGVSDTDVAGRPVLKLCLGYHGNSPEYVYSRARNMLIYLDYWDY